MIDALAAGRSAVPLNKPPSYGDPIGCQWTKKCAEPMGRRFPLREAQVAAVRGAQLDPPRRRHH